MSQPTASPFRADALEANRGGVLTEEQRRAMEAYVRNSRGNTLTTAAVVAVIGIVILMSRSFAWGAAMRPLAALAAFAIAGALVLGWLGVFSLLLRDARAGRVEAIEGPILRASGSWNTATASNRCYIKVAGRQFVTGRSGLEALPLAGIVRLYYLPRSRRVVNVERLPDGALAEAALESPAGLRSAMRESLSLNDTKRAEGRAKLAAVAAQLSGAFSAAGVAPAPQERDPRPLSQAIVGSWRGGMFSLTFSPDGSAAVSSALGQELHGRWSVDAAGRLRMDALGGQEAGEAWVVGDTLTVSLDGRALAFQRV